MTRSRRQPPPAPPGTLVIGLGNTLRRDDGVGRRAAEQLLAEGVAADAVLQPLPELALRLVSVERVLFLDADLAGRPGALRERALGPADALAEGHALDAPGVLALCAALHGRAPESRLLALGVADTGPGEGLSAPVAAALPAFLARARALVDAPWPAPRRRPVEVDGRA